MDELARVYAAQRQAYNGEGHVNRGIVVGLPQLRLNLEDERMSFDRNRQNQSEIVPYPMSVLRV